MIFESYIITLQYGYTCTSLLIVLAILVFSDKQLLYNNIHTVECQKNNTIVKLNISDCSTYLVSNINGSDEEILTNIGRKLFFRPKLINNSAHLMMSSNTVLVKNEKE